MAGTNLPFLPTRRTMIAGAAGAASGLVSLAAPHASPVASIEELAIRYHAWLCAERRHLVHQLYPGVPAALRCEPMDRMVNLWEFDPDRPVPYVASPVTRAASVLRTVGVSLEPDPDLPWGD